MNEYTGPEQQERTDGPRRSRMQNRSGEQEQRGESQADVKEVEAPKAGRRKRRWVWSLVWTLVILIILLAAGFGGVVVGYVFFGKQPWSDLLEWSTWRHVYDLVFSP